MELIGTGTYFLKIKTDKKSISFKKEKRGTVLCFTTPTGSINYWEKKGPACGDPTPLLGRI